MSFLLIFGIALGLAMDTFAVALAAGVTLHRVTAGHFFRLSFHFGLFQALMPILGWWIGCGAERFVTPWDHWVVFILLGYIGGKAVLQALRHAPSTAAHSDPSRGWQLIFLSVATSVDALAVGFSFSVLGVSVWYPSVIIGIITAAMTSTGLALGWKLREGLGNQLARYAELAGGSILIGIGVKILLQHLAA